MDPRLQLFGGVYGRLKKVAQTGPNRPLFHIVKMSENRVRSSKNRRRTTMKKTLALVVLTILGGLVAGTIPALAQSTNATLNSVCRPGTLYSSAAMRRFKIFESRGARLLKMAGIDSRGLTFEISTSIAFIIKDLFE